MRDISWREIIIPLILLVILIILFFIGLEFNWWQHFGYLNKVLGRENDTLVTTEVFGGWDETTQQPYLLFVSLVPQEPPSIKPPSVLLSEAGVKDAVGAASYLRDEIKQDTQDQIIALIKELWGNESKIALKVAMCESGLNPYAIGDPHLNPRSYGIFQIRAFKNRPSIEELFNWEINIKYAYQLYLKNGWSHWRNCALGNAISSQNYEKRNNYGASGAGS